MKGFGICGPPANAGENTYILQNESRNVEVTNNAAVAGQQRWRCRLLTFLPSG